MRIRTAWPRLRAAAATACLVGSLVQPLMVRGAYADQSQSASDTTSAVVTPPSIYWGAFVRDWPDNAAAIDQLEANVGKHMSIVHWGQPWADNGVPQQFQTSYFDVVRRRGSIPLVDWGSSDVCCDMVDQPQYQLSAITNGTYDGYITQWAQAAALWGHPLFLRFDAEMNGWWLPWSEQVNGNSPGDFVAAWQHVHDIFVQQGATNVSWVWCINEVSPHSTATSELYPGDNYVDWTCMDGYNWGTDRNNAWQSFSQVFTGDPRYGGHDTYQELIDVAPTKPIMLGEVASAENGGSKAAWISDMLGTQLPAAFPQIKAVVWFNHDAGDPTSPPWDISSSGQALAAFKTAIADPTYAGNAYATLDVSPIPPPEVIAPKP